MYRALFMSSCVVVLVLGLFTMQQPGNVSAGQSNGLPCDIEDGKSNAQATQDASRPRHLVNGEVLRIEGTTFVIKDEKGKEVKLQADQSTEKPAITQGDRISASVDNQNRAMWIRTNRNTDRRSEHASADCSPGEEASSDLKSKAGKAMGKD